jgi:hypothetical protein
MSILEFSMKLRSIVPYWRLSVFFKRNLTRIAGPLLSGLRKREYG